MSTPRNDTGNELTEQELNRLIRKIEQVYKDAADDLKQTIAEYFAQLEKRDAEMQSRLEDGEITEEYYKRWRLNQIGRGERWELLRDQIAERYTHANEVATSYVNDEMPWVYAENRNWTAYEMNVAGYNCLAFSLWNESTVKRLITENPDLMPHYPTNRAVKRGIDLAYGRRQITACITSAVLRGQSIKHMADDLQRRIRTMNRDSAIRTARTAFTAAQNGGRQAEYEAAADVGIKVKKRWRATKDLRTRDIHGAADGQVVPYDEPFIVGGEKMMYPGDSEHGASGFNLYNCRCYTQTANDRDLEVEPRMMRVRDTNGRYVLVQEMTYSEWKKWVSARGS